MSQHVRQAQLVTQTTLNPGENTMQLALFGVDGLPQHVSKQAAAQANFAGADLAALKVELNTFLGKLRTAGIIAT